jgi:hypothetical protein
LSFKDLRAEAFNGELRASGEWRWSDGQEPPFRLAPSLAALSVNQLLQRFAPELKDRLDGQLDFRGEFAAAALAGETLQQTLKGSGTALIRGGAIRDFNLLARLFYRRGAEEKDSESAHGAPASLAVAVQREDTPVRDFKARIAVEAQRIRADDVIFATPEYEITGAGWIDMDGATRWKGLLVFSPRVTRELRREYGAIRYFLDRKGRLAIAFRVDGKLPNITIRPENRALGRVFRWGAWQRGDDAPAREGRSGKNWLSDSLDRLLQADPPP